MKSILVILSLAVSMVLVSCAQKVVESQLATKLSAEEPVENSQELQSDARLLIENSKLSPAQKTEFKQLQQS